MAPMSGGRDFLLPPAGCLHIQKYVVGVLGRSFVIFRGCAELLEGF